MSRKYIFKAKTTNNIWIYGLPIEKNEKIYLIDLEDTSIITEIIPETLSEFTNRLMDDEKTEIYEHDIILYRDQYWVIEYCEALVGFQAVYYDADKKFHFFLPITQIIEGKLVGNSIDNSNFVNKKIE